MTTKNRNHIDRERGESSPWVDVPAIGPILRPSEAAAYYGISISRYYDMINSGDLPPFIKLGRRARASGVPRTWLDAVISARASSQSDERR